MNIRKFLLALLPALLAAPAIADVNVFTCEPEWAALADELGGDKVESYSAITPFQDPHFIQARPSLIARVRAADLMVCSGASLEIGWLPVLLRSSGNEDIMPGNPGFLEAAQYVERLGVPGTADRSAGDIHPYGNPHIQTDPRNIALVARELANRLKVIDRDNADYYEQRFVEFEQRWTANIERWTQAAESLRGMQIVVHHTSWPYLENWLGLEEVAALEPKPGLPPTASHLAELLDMMQETEVKLIVRSAYQSAQASEWLGGRTGIPAVVIPQTVGATEQADTLTHWFDDIIRRLSETNREASK